VDERDAGPRLSRLDLHFSVTLWPAPAGLTNEFADALRGFTYRFAISNLGTSDVRIDSELALQPVNDDLEMKLTHTADDRLAGLLVSGYFKAGIFGCKPLQPDAQLVLIL